MNNLTRRNKTLGQLMTDLRVRLGFASQGPASKNNDAIIKSFLEEAHDYVYSQLQPPAMRKRTEITLQRGETLYDWHNDIEDEDITPGNVKAVTLMHTPTMRYPLHYGITENDRSWVDMQQPPTRYDTLNGQLEVHPAPDQPYQLVIEYLQDKPRFTQPADRPGVPDTLVFLYALAKAKAHYRHPDAQAQAASFDSMLRTEKSSQLENRRFFIARPDGEVAPQVVATSAGYMLKV